jgi:hypothetical protein
MPAPGARPPPSLWLYWLYWLKNLVISSYYLGQCVLPGSQTAPVPIYMTLLTLQNQHGDSPEPDVHVCSG